MDPKDPGKRKRKTCPDVKSQHNYIRAAGRDDQQEEMEAPCEPHVSSAGVSLECGKAYLILAIREK